MRFSQDVWQRNLALYHKTLALPFNQELAQGTLSKAAFAHYVIQNSHYLIAYGRALAVCAAKAFDAEILFSLQMPPKLQLWWNVPYMTALCRSLIFPNRNLKVLR